MKNSAGAQRGEAADFPVMAANDADVGASCSSIGDSSNTMETESSPYTLESITGHLNEGEMTMFNLIRRNLLVEAAIPEYEKTCPRPFEAYRLALATGIITGSTNKINPYFHSSATNPNNKRGSQETVELPSKKSNFEFPAPRLTAREQMLPRPILTSTANQYRPLSEENLTTPTEEEKQAANAAKPPTPKIKPISLFRTPEYREILKRISNVLHVAFQVTFARDFIRIHPSNEAGHRAITAYFNEHKIQHFVLSDQINRPLKVVIRGLPSDFEEAEIEAELKNLGYNVIKVAQMIRRRDNTKMPLYQVQLENNEANNKIYDLSTLCFVRIIVVKYVAPNRIQQCYNCQFFHHHSENCKVNPRCVKCAGAHKTADCPEGKERIPEESLKCANCSGNHPANYTKCPRFPVKRTMAPMPTSYSNALSNTAVYAVPKATINPPPTSTYTRAVPRSDPGVTEFPPLPSQSNTGMSAMAAFIPELGEINAIASEIMKELQINDWSELLTELKSTLIAVQSGNSRTEKMMNFFRATMPTQTSPQVP